MLCPYISAFDDFMISSYLSIHSFRQAQNYNFSTQTDLGTQQKATIIQVFLGIRGS